MPNTFHNFRELIDKKYEIEYASFRFDDLTPEARMKFVKLLKARSSIYTIRRYNEEEIYACLDMVNPKIIRDGWNKGFGGSGDIHGWAEKEISRIIYYLNQRQVSPYQIESIENLTKTKIRN